MKIQFVNAPFGSGGGIGGLQEVFATYAALNAVAPSGRNLGYYLVSNDETHGDLTSWYLNDGLTYDWRDNHPTGGDDVTLVTTNFDGILSSSENTSQEAFEVIDDHEKAGSQTAQNTTHRNVVVGNPHVVTKTELGVENVTNDAQLKRAAGDIGTFDEKTAIHSDDIVLIEDSEDSNNKKRVKIKNLHKEEVVERFKIEGNTYAISTGKKGHKTAKFNYTLTKYEITSDLSCTMQADLWRATYANYDAGATHPVDGDSITASAPITITAGVKNTDATLSGWTKDINKGDKIECNVDSNDNAKDVEIVMYGVRR